jgi:hypothetical protein
MNLLGFGCRIMIVPHPRHIGRGLDAPAERMTAAHFRVTAWCSSSSGLVVDPLDAN